MPSNRKEEEAVVVAVAGEDSEVVSSVLDAVVVKSVRKLQIKHKPPQRTPTSQKRSLSLLSSRWETSLS